MLDRKSTKKPIDHAIKYLSLTMNSDPDLKDETYLQVLKQIKDHPEPGNMKRGWSFLSILASSFAPSPQLFYSILNFLLFEIKNNEDPEIIRRANYIFIRLVRVFEKPRKTIPSEIEIMHIEVLYNLIHLC